jgi:hypothetical protein
MKLDRVYVIALLGGGGDAEEVQQSADALTARYNGVSVPVDQTAMPTASNWAERIKADDKYTGTLAQIKSDCEAGHWLGVYVVSHGSAGTIAGGVVADDLAAFLAGIGFGPGSIKKLCVVACNVLISMESQATDQTYPGKLCSALKAFGLYPVVAAWTGYVTVMTPHSKVGLSFYDGTAKGKRLGNQDKQYAKTHAKKVIKDSRITQGPQYALATDDAREKQKRAFQYRDGSVKQVPLTDWKGANR